VTILQVIQRSAEFLAKKGVESPRLQVELLLAHVLKLPRMKLYLNFERELAETELNELRELVRRRGEREPLQLIVGSTSFCGLEMAVNGHVLIPRPETELLAEMGWEFLRARAKNTDIAKLKAMDFGTGSGCLAILLAAKCPEVKIVAVDISPEALAAAKRNAATHSVDCRIEFLPGDGFGVLTENARFDLIVSNPPYIPTAEIATLEPEVRDHDPKLALDGGADGLDFYRRIAAEAGNFLKPGARIMLEFGYGQAEAITKIFTEQKWIVEAVKTDYSGNQRILTAGRAN
jgi:release factor glutamine methyltransferase